MDEPGFEQLASDEPLSLLDAARSGNRVKLLKAVRDQLASDLQSCEGHGSAAIARELRATVLELTQLGVTEVDAVDELERRRAARRAGGAG